GSRPAPARRSMSEPWSRAQGPARRPCPWAVAQLVPPRSHPASRKVGQLFAAQGQELRGNSSGARAQGQEQLPDANAGSRTHQPSPSNAEVVRMAPTSKPCQLTSEVELSSCASG